MKHNNNYTYNYVIYNAKIDIVPNMYHELSQYEYVKVCNKGLISNNPILEFFHKIHWSNKINRKIRLPLKKLWFRKMTNGNFSDKSKPTCYIFLGGQYLMQEPELATYIKSLNPKNKIVIHFKDLLKSKASYLDVFREKSDLILTYDANDSRTHNIKLCPVYIYSKLAKSTEPDTFSNDLFFVGYSKGRLPLLIEMYDRLTPKGVKCSFWIAGVSKNEQVPRKGIKYLTKPVRYEKILNMVNLSRCVLELTQPNAAGHTLRTMESIVYKRKLLSNRDALLDTNIFNPVHMSVFSDINNIEIDYLKTPIPYGEINSSNCCSPKLELDFIEQQFKMQEV